MEVILIVAFSKTFLILIVAFSKTVFLLNQLGMELMEKSFL